MEIDMLGFTSEEKVMPEIGEIRKGREIGYKSSDLKYIWHACANCGKERWVELRHGKLRYLRCFSCIVRKGKHNPNWRGGQYLSEGYVFIRKPQHPMAEANGYVRRARLVLERTLGRYLLPEMLAHHKNEKKDDDSPGNLEEVTRGQHNTIHGKFKTLW